LAKQVTPGTYKRRWKRDIGNALWHLKVQGANRQVHSALSERSTIQRTLGDDGNDGVLRGGGAPYPRFHEFDDLLVNHASRRGAR
jgi:hypothetical protein